MSLAIWVSGASGDGQALHRVCKVVYTLDGSVWATMDTNPVPTESMVLDLQQQVWGCANNQGETCPSAATPSEVDMDIAWVVAYAPRPDRPK